MEETHLHIFTLLIYNLLNFVEQTGRLDDDIIFKNDRIFEALFETTPVEIHVPHETTYSPEIEIRYVRTFYRWVVMHF